MEPRVTSPGEIDGHDIAILLLLSYYCRVRLPDGANPARRALLLFLMRVIYQEIPHSSSLQEFLSLLRAAMACDTEQADIACQYLAKTLEIIDVPDGLSKVFTEKFSRILQPYETLGVLQVTEIFVERRSFFGLYLRRMKLVFDSMDLQARGKLRDAALAWRDSESAGPAGSAPTDPQEGIQDNLRVQAFEKYQTSMLRGVYNVAKDNMQKSFDYFAPGSDHELHQHTLLNLAAFHYETGSLSASKAALDEAISLARSVSDHECIMACESLMRRIQGEGSSHSAKELSGQGGERRLPTSQDALWQAQHDVAKGGTALLEVLQKLLDSIQPQASSSSVQANSQEMSLALMMESRRRLGKDAARPDAVVAALWQDLGESDIAEVYNTRAMRTSGSRAAITNAIKLDAKCRRAVKLATSGRYEEGLALLLHPGSYETLSFKEYQSWCEAVWDILWLRSKRRQEFKTLQKLARLDPGSKHILETHDIEELVEMPESLEEVLRSHSKDQSQGETRKGSEAMFGRRTYLTAKEKIEALLDKSRKLMNPTLAMSPVLLAIAMAKKLAFYRLQRSGIVALAEITGLSLKMSQHAKAAIEEVLPLILADDDLEKRGVAQWIYAQCILACAGPEKQELDVRQALAWLERAEKDMDAVSLIPLQRTVLYYMARLYHHLGEEGRRDETSARQAVVEKDWLRATESECPESLELVDSVMKIVKLVGGYVASGRAAAANLALK